MKNVEVALVIISVALIRAALRMRVKKKNLRAKINIKMLADMFFFLQSNTGQT